MNSISRIRPVDRFLPWDDVLHAGPVPGELSLEQLSSIRARFIFRCGWGGEDEVLARFVQRDRSLLSVHQEYDELILWFEHDLYDQLQLIQILAVLADHRPVRESRLPITLVCEDHFIGLSDPEVLKRDYRDRKQVTAEQFELAGEAWAAFTHFTPQKLEALFEEGKLSPLRYLRPALLRWFDEFPNAYDGLSSTERTVLYLINSGIHNAVELFAAVQDIEEAPFFGDAAFWRILNTMSSAPAHLIQSSDGLPFNPNFGMENKLNLTESGEQALSGIVVDSRRQIDRWMGGCHLRPGSGWYWNHVEETFQNDLAA